MYSLIKHTLHVYLINDLAHRIWNTYVSTIIKLLINSGAIYAFLRNTKVSRRELSFTLDIEVLYGQDYCGIQHSNCRYIDEYYANSAKYRSIRLHVNKTIVRTRCYICFARDFNNLHIDYTLELRIPFDLVDNLYAVETLKSIDHNIRG